LRGGKLIKGHLNRPALKDLDALKQQPTRLPDNVAVQPEGSPDTVEIGADSLKALFFVKNYEGRTDYREFKYFNFTPQVEGLWVRITFYDNERTEGVIHNSMQFLVDPGFFIKPPDPESNNEMAYVIKSSLVEFRVLGVKSSY
jgi:hypothetical protein